MIGNQALTTVLAGLARIVGQKFHLAQDASRRGNHFQRLSNHVTAVKSS
jgi:hypothetical protein